MQKRFFSIVAVVFFTSAFLLAQDTSIYKLRLNVPIVDFPQNASLAYHYPSMNQSMELSNDFYELGFWGIDELGNKLFLPKNKPVTKWRTFSNSAFKYALGLGFSQYGSELPIPLGVWAHEEFHRSVLGVNGISSKNGNWIFSRWDGTVYGISDSTLNKFKTENCDRLLYSYVSGVQSEIYSNQKTTLGDFYTNRSLKKNALLLYNAYYVFNYFKFSTGAISDSVKIIAPQYEDSNASGRDYAGADLTAWAYDMFNPSISFTSRDSFPNGDGVNRRIGFSDLTNEAQTFLIHQKKLSLINFLNPAIFFVNRIKINKTLSFNLFTQYAPTHFGNCISVFIPVMYKKYNLLARVDNFNNKTSHGFGIGLGLYNYQIQQKIRTDLSINAWNQPDSFFGNKNRSGGSAELKTSYLFHPDFCGYISLIGKTKGWTIANPYLNANFSVQAGISYQLKKKPN